MAISLTGWQVREAHAAVRRLLQGKHRSAEAASF
jgi:hypothetical protein